MATAAAVPPSGLELFQAGRDKPALLLKPHPAPANCPGLNEIDLSGQPLYLMRHYEARVRHAHAAQHQARFPSLAALAAGAQPTSVARGAAAAAWQRAQCQ